MDQLHIRSKEDKVNPNAVRAQISECKNSLVTPPAYRRLANGYFQEKVAQIYPIYQQKLRHNNALDFDDLLCLAIDLFVAMPDILNQYANQFQYIFIDEYQDTNEAQYKLVQLLAGQHQNLTVVGDMSQSIYSFRGATIQNIINFEKDYPGAKVFHLEQNYRSTQNILSAATHIILPNQKSHTILKLWTDNGTGEPIIQYQARDEQDEAQFVANRIKELTAPGTDIQLADVAVLYRTNAQSRVLEEAFLRAGLPYRLVGGIRFYDRKEIKDVLAYLRLCLNPTDSVAFARVANVPARGIGPATLRDGGPKLEAFKRDLELYQKAAQEMNVLELLDFILQHTKYHQYLDDGSDEAQVRWENVQELRTVAAEFAVAGPVESLQSFLENVALVESETKSSSTDQNMVTLMTLHAAKGLEFAAVFMVGLEEGIFPHSRAILDPSEMQEERRLAYVGVTRAKQLLHLVYAQQRALFGARSANQVSRFVIDIPEDILSDISQPSWPSTSSYGRFSPFTQPPSAITQAGTPSARSTIQWQKGDQVVHPVFGQGQVLRASIDTIEINFEEVGIKKLDPTFARLIKVNGS
jgi:DNA helicase-2/ATP-dependent DNA helicase PcrA